MVQALARGIFTVGLAMSVLIFIGGPERWSGPAFEAAMRYPWAPYSWAWAIGIPCLVGLIGSLISHLRWVGVSLFIVSVWCIFFGISLIQAAMGNPRAPFTGIPLYFGWAITCLLVGTVHTRSSRDAIHR